MAAFYDIHGRELEPCTCRHNTSEETACTICNGTGWRLPPEPLDLAIGDLVRIGLCGAVGHIIAITPEADLHPPSGIKMPSEYGDIVVRIKVLKREATSVRQC